MIKRTIIAAVIALSLLILPLLSVSAQSPTLTIIQPDPSEGVSIEAMKSSYAVGETVTVTMLFNPDNRGKQISSFRMTATDGDGVTTVTAVNHTLFLDGTFYRTYTFPMTPAGLYWITLRLGRHTAFKCP